MTTAATTPLLERPAAAELPVEHLLDLSVDLEPARAITTAVGGRMIFIAKGGTFEGPRLSGEILPGGGDFLLVGSDRVGRVDVHATLRTDDGVERRRREAVRREQLARRRDERGRGRLAALLLGRAHPGSKATSGSGRSVKST